MNGSQLSPVSMDGTSTHRYHGLLGDGGETFDQMVNGIVVRPAELSDMNSGGKYRLSGGTMSPSAGMLTNGPANNLGNRKTKNVNYNLKNRSNICLLYTSIQQVCNFPVTVWCLTTYLKCLIQLV